MKVLSLTQPWATLMALGAKKIETRSWATNYRGPLAIHAAKGLTSIGGRKGLIEICNTPPFWDVLSVSQYAAGVILVDTLPLGAIICVVDLVDCLPTAGAPHENGPGPKYADWVHQLTEQERAFGDYTPGRYGWVTENVRVLPAPVSARGSLGLWSYDGVLL